MTVRDLHLWGLTVDNHMLSYVPCGICVIPMVIPAIRSPIIHLTLYIHSQWRMGRRAKRKSLHCNTVLGGEKWERNGSGIIGCLAMSSSQKASLRLPLVRTLRLDTWPVSVLLRPSSAPSSKTCELTDLSLRTAISPHPLQSRTSNMSQSKKDGGSGWQLVPFASTDTLFSKVCAMTDFNVEVNCRWEFSCQCYMLKFLPGGKG